MLRVDLAAVREGPVAIDDRIAPDDPLMATTGLILATPLAVSGRLSTAGEDKFYWQATLKTVIRGECRRCLAPVDVPIAESLGLVFVMEAASEGDEDCYVVPRRASVLDLTAAVREELLLAAPQFVECRKDCKGLCPHCGADLNAGPCACTRKMDPRWEALTKLSRGE